jgi:thioredoxin 1
MYIYIKREKGMKISCLKTSLFAALLAQGIMSSTLLHAQVEEVRDEAHYNQVMNLNQPVLIEFAADWCHVCKGVKEAFHALSNEYQNVKFVVVNIDKFQELAQRTGILGVPTFIYVENGSTKNKDVGVEAKDSESFKNKVREHIKNSFAFASGSTRSATSAPLAQEVDAEKTEPAPAAHPTPVAAAPSAPAEAHPAAPAPNAVTHEAEKAHVEAPMAHAAAPAPAPAHEEAGFFGKIKGLFAWVFIKIKDLFMGIINWIKSLFGK